MGGQLAEMALKDRKLLYLPLLEHIINTDSEVVLDCLMVVQLICERPEGLLKIQEYILSESLIIEHFIKLLSSSSDQYKVIVLSIMTALCREQVNLQQMVVFAGAAEQCLELIKAEGGLVFGQRAIVKGCLELLTVLVNDNHGNQDYIGMQSAFHDFITNCFNDVEALEAEEHLATVESAWAMLAAFLSSDSPQLCRHQNLLSTNLLSVSCQQAILKQSPQAAVFLSRLVYNNDQVRLHFLKHHPHHQHTAVYLLVESILDKHSIPLLQVFESLLVNYTDGQLAIAATTAPGAESPGLLMVSRAQHRSRNHTAFFAYSLIAVVVSNNQAAATVMSKIWLEEEQMTLFEFLISDLLLLSDSCSDSKALLSGLCCLAVWLETEPRLGEWVLRECGGVVQSLTEKLQSDLDECVRGVSAVLLSILCRIEEKQNSEKVIPHPEKVIPAIIKTRIGLARFRTRIDSLCDSSSLLNPNMFPIVSFTRLFRLKYAQYRDPLQQQNDLFTLKLQQQADLIHSLKTQLGDTDHTLYQKMDNQIKQLQANNAALLEQLMAVDAEKEQVLCKLSAMEEKERELQEKEHSNDTTTFFKSLKTVLLPEFEERTNNSKT